MKNHSVFELCTKRRTNSNTEQTYYPMPNKNVLENMVNSCKQIHDQLLASPLYPQDSCVAYKRLQIVEHKLLDPTCIDLLKQLVIFQNSTIKQLQNVYSDLKNEVSST